MQRKSLLYCLLACLTSLMFMWTGSGFAQNSSLRPEAVAITIYQQLTYLPKNNDYRRLETGEVNPDNTLISRFIRYHQDVKKRPTEFRIDWQLTMSDYLGFNEPVKADRYPGSTTLQTNPMEADLKSIRSLNRAQRRALIDLLASIYEIKKPENPSNPSVSPSVTPSKPSLSKPGDAQLLLP